MISVLVLLAWCLASAMTAWLWSRFHAALRSRKNGASFVESD